MLVYLYSYSRHLLRGSVLLSFRHRFWLNYTLCVQGDFFAITRERISTCLFIFMVVLGLILEQIIRGIQRDVRDWGFTVKYNCSMCILAQRVNIIALNIQDMVNASKRYAVFSWLCQYQPAIMCLSEIYLTKEWVHSIRRPWIGQAYHSFYLFDSF